MPNSDPWDGFVHPYLKLVSDSYILTLTKILDLVVFFHQVCKNSVNAYGITTSMRGPLAKKYVIPRSLNCHLTLLLV